MSSSQPKPVPQQVDIAIIGAGLAGLTAARELKKHNYNLAVFEARDRIGGRVHSETLPNGLTIDLGAQFVGSAQTQVSKLIAEAGLSLTKPHQKGAHLKVFSGLMPGRKSADTLPPLKWYQKLDALFLYTGLRRHLRQFLALSPQERYARYGTIPADVFLRKLSFLQSTAEVLGHFAAGEFCAPLSQYSAYEFLDQVHSIGGVEGEASSAEFYLQEGAQALATFLAQTVQAELHLNTAVHSIALHPQGVQLVTPQGECLAKKLVVAIPPQLYAQVGLFNVLPADRIEVLARFTTGSVVKNILVFEQPWWRAQGLSGVILQPGHMFGAAVDASPADGSSGVLVVFSSSEGSKPLAAIPDEQERVQLVINWLTAVTGMAIPAPVYARSVNWVTESYSLGGYASRRGLGGWKLDGQLFAAYQGIHFAGTETATHWRSFMDGAIESGLRAAQEILAERLVAR